MRCWKRDLLPAWRLLALHWDDELPLKWSLPVSSRFPSKASVSFQSGNRATHAFHVGNPWKAGRRREGGAPEPQSAAMKLTWTLPWPSLCALTGWSCLCRMLAWSSLWLPRLSGVPFPGTWDHRRKGIWEMQFWLLSHNVEALKGVMATSRSQETVQRTTWHTSWGHSSNILMETPQPCSLFHVSPCFILQSTPWELP